MFLLQKEQRKAGGLGKYTQIHVFYFLKPANFFELDS